MSEVWYTKHGPRRVRRDPPTLKEAIVAAQGLTADAKQQAEIAAALMNVPVEEAESEIAKLAPARPAVQVLAPGRDGHVRAVTVERKPCRRLMPGINRGR
jgi:hypothetical protein